MYTPELRRWLFPRSRTCVYPVRISSMVSNVLRKPKTAGSYILLSDSEKKKKIKDNSYLDLSSNGRDCNNKQRQVEKYTRFTPWGLGVSVCDKHADGKFTAQKGQNYHTAFRSGSSETSALRFIVQPTPSLLSLSLYLSLPVCLACSSSSSSSNSHSPLLLGSRACLLFSG